MLTVMTRNPEELLEHIKNLIDQRRITSWIYDKDGDFTLAHLINTQRAWFHPTIADGKLRFCIIGVNNEIMKKSTYAKYHSRLISILLEYFDDEFLSARISARKSIYDKFD